MRGELVPEAPQKDVTLKSNIESDASITALSRALMSVIPKSFVKEVFLVIFVGSDRGICGLNNCNGKRKATSGVSLLLPCVERYVKRSAALLKTAGCGLREFYNAYQPIRIKYSD